MLLAQGARLGGHSLFVKDRRLWYAYNFVGIPPEQQIVSTRELEPGDHVLGVEFVKESLGDRHETHGTARLYVDDGSSQRARCARSRATSRSVARACRSAATPATR